MSRIANGIGYSRAAPIPNCSNWNQRIAIVRPFAFSVRMMNNQAEAGVGTRGDPLEHLVIAIGIAEGSNGAVNSQHADSGSPLAACFQGGSIVAGVPG